MSSYLSGRGVRGGRASAVGRRVPLGSLAVPPYNVAIAVDRGAWACVIKCNQGTECSELPAFSSLSAGCCSSFPLNVAFHGHIDTGRGALRARVDDGLPLDPVYSAFHLTVSPGKGPR